MISRNAQAFWRRTIRLRGVSVQVQRLTGYAPNVVSVTATLRALVEKVAANTAAEAQTGIPSSATGQISQSDRKVTLVADDLSLQRFPLPMAKGDKVTIEGDDEALSVSEVDGTTEKFAGVVILTVTGTT